MGQSLLKAGRKIAFSYALASKPGPIARPQREHWHLRLSWKLQAEGFARPDLFSIRRRLVLLIAAGGQWVLKYSRRGIRVSKRLRATEGSRFLTCGEALMCTRTTAVCDSSAWPATSLPSRTMAESRWNWKAIPLTAAK